MFSLHMMVHEIEFHLKNVAVEIKNIQVNADYRSLALQLVQDDFMKILEEKKTKSKKTSPADVWLTFKNELMEGSIAARRGELDDDDDDDVVVPPTKTTTTASNAPVDVGVDECSNIAAVQTNDALVFTQPFVTHVPVPAAQSIQSSEAEAAAAEAAAAPQDHLHVHEKVTKIKCQM